MFNICKNKVWLLLLPIALIIAGIIGFIVNGGFQQDIDFAGGTTMHIAIGKTLTSEEREELAKIYTQAAGIEQQAIVQTTGTNGSEVIIKTTSLEEEQKTAAFNAVKEKYGLEDSAMLGTSSQSASYGNEMKFNTLLFSVIAALLMLVYIAFRFEWRSAIMAVLALIINILVMLSVYALFKIPLSTSFIAAILTVLGYSINDTIIIFDRIRENVRFAKKESATSVAERSIWQTFNRTINTVLTTLITIVILYFMGVQAIKDFTLPLIIGILSGAYTSIFIAGPWWAAWKDADTNAIAQAKGGQAKSKKK